ncbi:hypothetical protein Tco_0117681 [Tanacetum coccineum]
MQKCIVDIKLMYMLVGGGSKNKNGSHIDHFGHRSKVGVDNWSDEDVECSEVGDEIGVVWGCVGELECVGEVGMGEIMIGDGTGYGKKIGEDEGFILDVSVGVEEGYPNLRCHKWLSLQMVFTEGIVGDGDVESEWVIGKGWDEKDIVKCELWLYSNRTSDSN